MVIGQEISAISENIKDRTFLAILPLMSDTFLYGGFQRDEKLSVHHLVNSLAAFSG